MNQAVMKIAQQKQQTLQSQTPKLKAINNPDHKHVPQGLKEIRALLGDDRYMPEHVYTKLLTERERTLVCFAAGLKKSDLNKAFSQFTFEQRDNIRKAILLMQDIVKAFTGANAMAPAKFYKGAKRDHVEGCFDAANQLNQH